MPSVPVGQPPLAVAAFDRLIPDGRSVRGPPLRVRRCLAAQARKLGAARWLVPQAQADFGLADATGTAGTVSDSGWLVHTL